MKRKHAKKSEKYAFAAALFLSAAMILSGCADRDGSGYVGDDGCVTDAENTGKAGKTGGNGAASDAGANGGAAAFGTGTNGFGANDSDGGRSGTDVPDVLDPLR